MCLSLSKGMHKTSIINEHNNSYTAATLDGIEAPAPLPSSPFLAAASTSPFTPVSENWLVYRFLTHTKPRSIPTYKFPLPLPQNARALFAS